MDIQNNEDLGAMRSSRTIVEKGTRQRGVTIQQKEGGHDPKQIASAMFNSATTQDTMGVRSSGQFNTMRGSVRTGTILPGQALSLTASATRQPTMQGSSGGDRRRGQTANMGSRTEQKQAFVDDELNSDQQEGLQMRDQYSTIKSAANARDPYGDEVQQGPPSFNGSRFFRGATTMNKQSYGKFKVKRAPHQPPNGYLFKVKQLPTAQLLKLRHDERVQEADYAAKLPHYEKQFNEFLALKEANTTTNKDRRVVMVRPNTSALDSVSIQTQHLRNEPPSRGVSQSLINHDKTTQPKQRMVLKANFTGQNRSPRTKQGKNRMRVTLGSKQNADVDLGVSYERRLQSQGGPRKQLYLNTGDREAQCVSSDFNTIQQVAGSQIIPEGQHQGELVNDLFLCKPASDQQYRVSKAGKNNTSTKITKRVKHYNSFKYPTSSMEGQEYTHLAQHPLHLNDHVRNYTLTAKKSQNRDRYRGQEAQRIDTERMGTESPKGALTSPKKAYAAKVSVVNREALQLHVQASSESTEKNMILIADPDNEIQQDITNFEQDGQDYMQQNPDTQETEQLVQAILIDSDEHQEEPQSQINLNYKGYERWFNRQVRQMVSSDNVSYKIRECKAHIFGQMKRYGQAKHCNQTLKVGGITKPGYALGGPLTYTRKAMPRGSSADFWANRGGQGYSQQYTSQVSFPSGYHAGQADISGDPQTGVHYYQAK